MTIINNGDWGLFEGLYTMEWCLPVYRESVSECSLSYGLRTASHLRREKEGAQTTASQLGRTQQEGGGNLVRYNNKVRINFFFETFERERKMGGELSDYEVRAACHILEAKREMGAWTN